MRITRKAMLHAWCQHAVVAVVAAVLAAVLVMVRSASRVWSMSAWNGLSIS